MLPLSDVNPTRRAPFITYGLIGVNVVVFLLQVGMDQRDLTALYDAQSIVPLYVSQAPFALETLLDGLRSMFLHGGWLHLLSNMLYLWIFGDNIEDRLGRVFYVALYLVSGYVAIYAQVMIDPESQIPLVGASGAIAGVLGSYALLYPRVSVRGLIFFGYFARFVELPALLVLGFWFVIQLFNGLMSFGPQTGAGGGVAFFAHIGGFVAGLLLTQILIRFIPDPNDNEVVSWDR
jgi:membrane associated rhomboid family serine protease